MEQVEEVRAAALRAEVDGFTTAAPILRRSAYVLSVAAFDSYFHERAVDLLRANALSGLSGAGTVANYIRSTSASDVAGPSGEGHIRLRLSYRTLVAPDAIDALLAASGRDAADCWLQTAIALTSRQDRLRRLLGLIYDRRNVIAHEADWDIVQLDFRAMESSHIEECVVHLTSLAESLDSIL